ncbi:MAG: glycosyltransferase, partial [Bacteroidia bacterium]|nr:glycosyltransferase [Bacteroidia bacterium]
MVSICCITYNHEPFIRQCLDGFLMQKTDFPFKIVIHDDCSTDKTPDVIREYKQKYPDILCPIFQEVNQMSKGHSITVEFVLPACHGKYIALCEGDDYWTDPLKLQKQVDFLEAHPEYSLCGHNTKIVYENDGGRVEYFRPARSSQTKTELNMDDMIVDFH